MKVVGVCSIKGGTGKSLVAVNLSHHLKNYGKVGLLDSDIDSSNLAEFIGEVGRIDVTPDKKFKLVEWNGVKVWSMSLLTEKHRPITLTGEHYCRMLNDAVHHSDWDVDYLVIDLPAGAADTLRGTIYIFARYYVGNVIVIQPAFPDNARRVIKLHKVNDIPVIGLIENMSYFLCTKHDEPIRYDIFGAGTGKKLAEEFGIEFLGEVPLIADLQDRIKQGNPILEDSYSEPFKKASKIISEVPIEKVGIIKRIKEKIEEVTRESAIKIIAFMIGKIGKEVAVPSTYKFDPGVVSDLVITDDTRMKTLARFHLRVREDGMLTYVKNPSKVDFEIEMPFRTLARIVMGKKKLRDGTVISYDAWDAYLNEELDLYGEGATQRAVGIFRDVLFNENLMKSARGEFKFLERYI